MPVVPLPCPKCHEKVTGHSIIPPKRKEGVSTRSHTERGLTGYWHIREPDEPSSHRKSFRHVVYLIITTTKASQRKSDRNIMTPRDATQIAWSKKANTCGKLKLHLPQKTQPAYLHTSKNCTFWESWSGYQMINGQGLITSWKWRMERQRPRRKWKKPATHSRSSYVCLRED